MPTILSLGADFLAQCLVLFYPPVLLFWLIIHTGIVRWRRLGTRSYWIATLVWPAITGPLLYFRRPLFSMRWQSPWWLVALGVAAWAVAIWAAVRSSRVISGKTLVGVPELNPSGKVQPLMQTGIYSKTRNPIYFAHVLFIFGGAAITGFAASWAMLALDALVLPMMIRAEERELLTRYGSEYRDYMSRTPRLFPKWPW